MGKKYITDDLDVNGRIIHNGITEDNVNSTSIIEVAQASDLPLSLAANTTYVVRGTVSISTSHTITNSGCAIIGHDRNKDKLVYTGTGTFLTLTDETFLLEDVWLSSTNSASTLLVATDVAASGYNFSRNHFLSIINCQFRNVAGNVMDVKGFDLVDFNNTTFFYISSPTFGCRFQDVSKLEISSCEFIRWFNESSLPTPSGYATCSMIELQANSLASFGAVNINGCIIHPQQTQNALEISTSSTTGFGTVVANAFVTVGLTTGVILAGSTYDDTSMLKYDVVANQGLKDSKAYVFGYQTGTSVQSATTTFSPLTPGSLSLGVVQRFTQSSNGVLEYTGIKPLEVLLSMNLRIEGVGSRDEQFEFQFAKNGTLIPGSATGVELDNGEEGPVSAGAITEVEVGDQISLYYRSPTNDNFTLANYSIRITQV
ncbi:hypothetical protein N8035_02335 [Algibacter sp.]|nr:hypothetical protein [Algibacter sp.]